MAATLPYSQYNLKDKASGSLLLTMLAADSSFTFVAGHGARFPASDFCVRVDDETIYVATRAGDVCSSLTRGYNGSVAAGHSVGAVVMQSSDAALFQRIYDNLAGHTHVKADVSDFGHTHPQGDITNLVSDLAGKAASSHTHIANEITSGTIATARLGGGTATSSTFLRGDQTWAAPTGGADPFATFVGVTSGDISTAANTTPVTVTGLVFNYVANSVYVVEIFGRVSAPVATTGCGLQFDLSTTVDFVSLSFFHQLANAGTLTGGHSIADDASAGVSSGIPVAAGIYPLYAAGLIDTNANAGTAQLRFRSEVAAVATLKAGTVMRVHKVA